MSLIRSVAHVKMELNGRSGVVRTAAGDESPVCYTKEQMYNALREGLDAGTITEEERMVVADQIEGLKVPRYLSDLPQAALDLLCLKKDLEAGMTAPEDELEDETPPHLIN